jgi:hypothetical protein
MNKEKVKVRIKEIDGLIGHRFKKPRITIEYFDYEIETRVQFETFDIVLHKTIATTYSDSRLKEPYTDARFFYNEDSYGTILGGEVTPINNEEYKIIFKFINEDGEEVENDITVTGTNYAYYFELK